jgi:hypothetical protein
MVYHLLFLTEDVTIILQPEPFVKVKEGQQLVMSTEATGFPYPRYMWYRFDNKANESVPTSHTQASLRIPQAR